MFDSLRADVTYAVRWLARSPGFTLVAVASLAIGIGFNTAIFSVVDALLLRPLPVERPDRLVDVYTRGGDGDTYATSSYPDYLDFRDRNGVFSALMAFSPAIAAVKAGDQSRMALGEVVSGNYFQVLGVGAALGRALVTSDDVAGAARAVVISDAAWARDYGRDRQVLGRTMRIHGQPYTIVGVAPPSFTGMVPMLQPEFWLAAAWVEEVEPAGMQDVVPSPGNTRLERRGQRWLFLKGRLKEGETPQRAEANLQVIDGAARPGLSEVQREAPHRRRQQRPRASDGRPDAAAGRGRADGGHRPRAAGRVRQRREHAARPGLGTPEGDRHSPGDWRGTPPHRPPDC